MGKNNTKNSIKKVLKDNFPKVGLRRFSITKKYDEFEIKSPYYGVNCVLRENDSPDTLIRHIKWQTYSLADF